MWIFEGEQVGVSVQVYQPSKFRELVYFCNKLSLRHNNNGRFSSPTQELLHAPHHQQHNQFVCFSVTVLKEN